MADHPPKPAKDGVPSQGSSSDNTPQIQPIKTQEKTTPPQGKTTNLEWLTVMFAAAREKARNRTPEERQEFYRKYGQLRATSPRTAWRWRAMREAERVSEEGFKAMDAAETAEWQEESDREMSKAVEFRHGRGLGL